MEGVRIACLYSYGCPDLKRIGAEKLIFDFIKDTDKSKLSLVKGILEKLEPCLFYRLIGKMNDIDNPFNLHVVKAYWLGNNLLRTIKKEDISISSVYSLKLSDFVGGKAHHNFSVIWSTKRASNIPIEKFDECLIKPGKIIELKEKNILVETKRLFSERKKIYFKDTTQEISREVLRGLISFDDWVSIHFGTAREKISRNCAQNLIEITKEAISLFQKG